MRIKCGRLKVIRRCIWLSPYSAPVHRIAEEVPHGCKLFFAPICLQRINMADDSEGALLKRDPAYWIQENVEKEST